LPSGITSTSTSSKSEATRCESVWRHRVRFPSIAGKSCAPLPAGRDKALLARCPLSLLPRNDARACCRRLPAPFVAGFDSVVCGAAPAGALGGQPQPRSRHLPKALSWRGHGRPLPVSDCNAFMAGMPDLHGNQAAKKAVEGRVLVPSDSAEASARVACYGKSVVFGRRLG
jgi:hypothetical protein